MLERLSVLGMVIAEEITQRMVDSPYHPEPVHEPGRAFAQVSRAVRLTVALEAKVGAEIIALRNGVTLPGGAMKVASTSWSAPSAADRRALVRARPDKRDSDDRETRVEQTRESLTETECDGRLAGDFRAAVQTMCSDRGLDPDWSRWPETKDVELVPIVSMLAEFLSTAKATAPAVPSKDDQAVRAPGVPGPVGLPLKPRSPPGD